MNHKIQELADQCWKETIRYTKEGPVTQSEFDYEKFAELIVKECLDIVNRKEYSYHEADPLWETAQLIKNHFGMKE